MFWISDALARLLLAISIVAAATYPIAGPVFARMEHRQITAFSIVVTCLLSLSVALGAHLITRRRAFGLLLVTVPMFVAAGGLNGVAPAAALALVFGLPFVLTLLRARTVSRVTP
jgi:hypothetical protein